jgi:carbon-monoxide dehydrogenase small subunit
MNEIVNAAVNVTITVNGRVWHGALEPRLSLGDFLREILNLTGTHLGCEHGVCGACTVLVDDQPQRACLAIAVAMDGRQVTTVEGLNGPVSAALRSAFSEQHALQCGFCTPGMLISATDIITRRVCKTEAQIRHELAGNICRCTGYRGIVAAIANVAKQEAKL